MRDWRRRALARGRLIEGIPRRKGDKAGEEEEKGEIASDELALAYANVWRVRDAACHGLEV